MQIDLTTIGGIAAVTMAVVSALKRGLARAKFFSDIPIWVYALLTSSALTYLAHDVFATLPGDDLKSLIGQAVMASLIASGAFEQGRAAVKPLADSTTAKRARGWFPVILLTAVMASTSACATIGFDGSSPQAQQAKLAELAKMVGTADRVLVIAHTIQDVEIKAHQNGRVSDAQHLIIQQAFKDFAGSTETALLLCRDLSKPDATRWDAARSVGLIGMELLARIEPLIPPEVSVYLNSFRLTLQLLGVS